MRRCVGVSVGRPSHLWVGIILWHQMKWESKLFLDHDGLYTEGGPWPRLSWPREVVCGAHFQASSVLFYVRIFFGIFYIRGCRSTRLEINDTRLADP